ncbi:hypothetical protein [Arthrobacter sp. N199823]|uniref:hypothetical protein n=1 Tax=Arthrobacter sp. N199823 TaxID=2058895 RepID=UPI000CE40B94|nr:hypothetical protein [Arthrobacter sp. N199823]
MSDKIEEAVMAENNAKIHAGRALETAINAENLAQEQLKEAQRASAAARREALKVGWDEKSLKQLGLVTLRRKTRQPKIENDQHVVTNEH